MAVKRMASRKNFYEVLRTAWAEIAEICPVGQIEARWFLHDSGAVYKSFYAKITAEH